ncbi:hypothetical protein Poli38472_004751 [Pythium oligandrum]|uniref:Uncharacterized protein n=1 Tax=Pythium oligandrum TaxID=41045 RepID=A0A8K1CC80_PYTOL|nr:hypothetical protein Poli38472_004751 [Pythium oligandrum]|eukprot:TMW59682.1 hypothetical protein Poli38472_004751 [Pythium oligandrum]
MEVVVELLHQGHQVLQTAAKANDELSITAKRQVDQLEIVGSLLKQGKIRPSILLHKYLEQFEDQLSSFATYQSQSRWYKLKNKSDMRRRFRECDIRFRIMTKTGSIDRGDFILKPEAPIQLTKIKRRMTDVETCEHMSECSTANSSPTGSSVGAYGPFLSEDDLAKADHNSNGLETSPSPRQSAGPAQCFHALYLLLTCGRNLALERNALKRFDAVMKALDDEKRDETILLGVIMPLLRDLQTGSPIRRLHASNALRVLATRRDVCKILIDAGVVSQLIELTQKGIAVADLEAVIGLLPIALVMSS